MLQFEERKYRLSGITPLLGSQPANPDVRAAYIASKAPTEWQRAEENDMLPDDERGVTVFLRRLGDDALSMMDYVLVGYLKSACKSLSAQNGIQQAESKVGTYVFVEPRTIPILRNGEPVIEEDSVLERPLRAQTMQGPRVALASSEQVDDPWTLEFSIRLLINEGTAKSKPVTWEAIEDALDYGRLKGLGQWRNGGYGRFTWERVDV